MIELVSTVKEILDQSLQLKPDGYNVGFNSGDAAGQTVPHVHVHVIPRYTGDVEDPTGGVRFVIPSKANYLMDSHYPTPSTKPLAGPFLTTGHPHSSLWDQLSWRIAGAKTIDVLVSFVQSSGLDVIQQRLFDAIRNDARARILVSDYLYISDPRAIRRLLAWCELATEEFGSERLLVRLIETAKLPSKPASFHPKAWRIAEDQRDFISVGSSNLSKPALQTGIEWNLLSEVGVADTSHSQVATEFESLWKVGTPLTVDVVNQYADRAAEYREANFEPESIDEQETPSPRPWQIDALASLKRIREAGHSRALVAVATGMGKTWLAAFDACQFGETIKRRPRVLVIAHRAHILSQAESAISRMLDDRFAPGSTAWYIGNRSELVGDLVIASIQKLSRPEGLRRLTADHFDYVVMDEVHHAEAPSYRRVLAKLQCDFTLGLTATPERTDGVDVATIFDDNLAHQATIGDGIAEESLVPFHYVGIKDTVDFRQIPWRNGRFDIAELEDRVARSERMDCLWSAMEQHPADRTLLFCCSRRHAVFARDWLRSRGLSSAAVFSGEGSDSYGDSLQRLRSGELQTLCVVDMFNEGLDIPAVDRIVMLRPTESKIIFLQQLGRGLRASEGKTRLLVIDFVGNHRVFAQRIIHLLSLRGPIDQWKTLKRWLDGKPVELPDGCLLDVELDAKDMLKQFLPQGRAAGIEGYRAIRDDLGRRPTALEVFSKGFLPKAISAGAGGWFTFTHKEGDLTQPEANVAEKYGEWLKTVETTSLNKSYKMVVLRVLLDNEGLFSSVDLYDFSKQCRRFMLNHEVLCRDLVGENHAVDHKDASDQEWADWWIRWPISRWLATQNGKVWFKREGDQFHCRIDCSNHLKSTLEAMTAELVDWRLAAYSKNRRLVEPEQSQNSFDGKVSHSSGKPILFIPEKARMPGRPVGPTRVRLPGGDEWEFKFMRVACNVAKPKCEKKNQLGKLLKDWFGPNAGLPGTDFHVRFESQDGVWQVSPIGIETDRTTAPKPEATELEITEDSELIIEISVPKSAQYSTHVPVYELTAAAGDWGPQSIPEDIGWISVSNQRLSEGMFAAQVVGHSMEPKIPSGSYCLFRPCPAGTREGRMLLVQANTLADPEDGGRYTVKRYHSTKQVTEEGWRQNTIELQPLNSDYQPIQITEENADEVRIIGEFVCLVANHDHS
ncbi:type I restriction enzyme EcoKI subunit R [Novipirellula artificiosorum]|uniref:Type I restriction enzyme EcoKI subunit R n=2 Tax=Novipirellula artificiosorum TaxID=2528016 RepID=A0A5C6DTI0_9BACT|nr:type I restriction enzyme EcoKI subunit R [Novipirellula artificiosorum]